MKRSHRLRRPVLGLSLIELMIALTIGSFLVLGLVQVFSASRAAYQLSQGIARNQENARFAMDFLVRDLRMAGHAGCVNDQSLLADNGAAAPTITGGNIRSLFMTLADRNDNKVQNLPFPLRFDMGIEGFEAKGTVPGEAITLSAAPSVGGAGDWKPQLPAALSGLARPPIAGSDIVVLRYFSPEQTPISGLTMGPVSTLDYPEASGGVATGGSGLFALADCNGASVFQASTVGTKQMTVKAVGLNRSSLHEISKNDGAITYKKGDAVLYRAESVAYYVALNAQGVPSLYRVRWVAAPGEGAVAANSEELVEGIESLQFLYGEDSNSTNPALLPTGNITKTSTAADIASASQWRRVGAVQIGLMVRGGGNEPAASAQPQVAQKVLQVEMTTPADGHYRSVYENTVALRNRLFGN
jgi:type IV pilus assembly protein PilW